MTVVYQTETRTQAWLQATRDILDDKDDLNVRRYDRSNVLLEIDSPGMRDPLDEIAFENLDRQYREAGQPPIHAVAEWIFPGWLYRREGIDGVYDTYLDRYDQFLDARVHKWGTYAGRLLRRPHPDNDSTFNPLQVLIEKMRKFRENDGGTFHTCYELGIPFGPFDIPLYDPSSDRHLPRQLPCLSHLSFDLSDDRVHMTALYRLHDYRWKVPGNLLGLARLQACVAAEVGVNIGRLVVHSARAKVITRPAGMGEFKELLGALEEGRGIEA